jgi:hypothetical protein
LLKVLILFKERNVIIMEAIKIALETAGYDYAVAIATQAEIKANAACGQLSLIDEK